MPNVTITPPSTIRVQVGTNRQPVIATSSVFNGSPTTSQQEIDAAFATANASYATANTALVEVNSAYNQSNNAYNLANTALPSTGGEITGNLVVDGTFTAIIDAGTF